MKGNSAAFIWVCFNFRSSGIRGTWDASHASYRLVQSLMADNVFGMGLFSMTLRNPGDQLDFDAGGRIRKLDAECRARRRVLREEAPVNLIHGVLFGLHIRQKDSHLQ